MKKINLLVLCGLLCAAKPALAQTSAPAPGVVITSIVNPFSCVGGPYNGTINVRVADNFTNFPYEIVLYDELFNLVSSHLAGFNFEERDFFVPPGRYWIKLQKDGQQIPEAIPVPVTVADPGIEVSVLNVSYTTAEKSTGSIELAARSSGNGIFYYSIDNRTTWQTSNVFQNLSAGTYQITVKNDFGCESTVQVEVRVKNLIEIQPQNMIYNQSYDRYGNIRAFYVYAEPTNSANTLSYQWYKWNSIYYWEEIQGATSAYYDPVDINIQNYNLTPEGKYYCRVTETGTDNVEYSDEVCLTVMRLCPSLASIGHYYINLDFGAGTLAETISWNCIQGIYGRTSNIFYSIFELHLPINGLQITVHYPGNRTAIYSDFDGISHDPQLHVAYSYSYLCYKDVPAVVLFDDIRGNGNDYHNRWYRWSIEGVVGMGRIPIESWGDRPWDYTGNLNPVTIPSNIILDILTAGGNRFWLVLEYDNGNGCRYEARAEITIINPIIEQQPDLEVCSGEEVKIPPFIINTDFPSSLNWYVDDPVFSAGGTSGSGNIPSFMAPQNQGDSDKVGKFTVVNQILANCYDFMQFNVKVKPVAFPLIHQRDIVICQNKSDFNLSEIVTAAPVAPGAMLKWYDEQKQPVPVNPPAVTPLINTSIAGTQTYYVTQALNGTCESPVEEGMITVRIKPQATWNSFKVLYDANTCPAAGMMIEAVSDLTNPVYRWYDSQNTNVLLHTGSIYESFPSPYYEDVHYIRVTVESDELCEGVGGEGHDGKISVRDIIAPTGSCPADITVDADESGTSSKVEYELNYADNCSEVSYKLIEGLASGEVFPAGKTRVVYDISDKSKNTVRCEFWVTVVTQCETPAPPIIAERDIVLCRNASGFTLSAQGNNLFWYDEQMQLLSQPPQISPTVAGTYTYYVTQSDGSCESPKEEGMITVRIKPQATWNSFKVLYDANTCPAAGMMIEAVSDLTNPVYRWYDSQNTNVLLHTGSTYESFPGPYYEDVHYIRVTVESDELCEGVGGEGHDGKIIVRDNKAPTGSCPADITVDADESGTSAKVEYELNYADNCSEVSYKLIAGLVSGEAFPVGETSVVYEVSDKAGNTVRCEFTVTVIVVKLPGDLCTTCSDITAYGSVPQHGFKWELCSNGTLTIGGTGTIQNFSQWVSANHIASITRVVICPGIIAIGNNAFKDFFNMTSVSIPETVTSIGNRAFSGCRGLTSLTIPASVVHIENFAFEGCKGLKEIINHSPVPQTINPNQDAFRYVDRNTCTLIVPKGSENAYRFAPGWIGFKMGNAGNASLEGTVTGIDTASDSIWVHLYIQSSLMKSSGNEDLILVASVLVGPGGQYSFENLPAGVYIVKLVFNEDNEYKSPPSDPVQLTGGATGGTVNFTVNAGTQTVTPGKPTLSGLTGTEDVFAFDLKIYPNPFTDAVRIIFTDAVETWHAASLHIINAAGIIVHTQTITSPDETIHLGHLPAGMYIFRIEKDGKVKTFKIIKIQ